MATGVPANILIPFVGVEIDASNAFQGSAAVPITALLTGQMMSTGTGTEKVKYLVTSAAEVAAYGGFGSQIHRQAINWFANNQTTTCYIIMLADAVAAAAATTAITLGGTTASVAGEVDLYIAGTRIDTSVAIADAFDDVGDAMVVEINLEVDLPVTAAYATPTLTLTAKNKGVSAGDLDVRLNYNAGEILPTGITVVIGTTTPGTGDTDAQDVIDTIGETWYNVVAHTYDDATNLDLLETFAIAQNEPMVQKDGVWYFGQRDSRSNMITFATNSARNNQFMVMLPSESRLESTWELAAAVAGQTAKSIESDSAVPLHRMTLQGLKTVAVDDRWTSIERNQLAQNGIATITDTNGVQTESTVTMYRLNSSGAADVAYQFQNTMFILMELRYTWVNWILTKYPRAKLGDDDALLNLNPGQQIMTPKVGRTESVAWFKLKQREGKVENLELFKEQLQVVRDTNNVNRLNFLLPPDIMNQFIVGSGIMQFQLEATGA